MLIIENSRHFQDFLKIQKDNGRQFMLLSMLLFGSMGAITWAIRGTAGWGGVDGTVIPGMMWALLWYYLSRRAGIDARSIIFWLGFGIALGGELGYGQYVSWMRGIFYAGEKTVTVNPLNGYLWMAICGIGWAGPAGILLGWAANDNIGVRQWVIRFSLLLLLLIFLFAWPFIDWISLKIAEIYPALIFPNASLGIYSAELGHHLQRTVYTNTQNFLVLIWWISALLFSLFRKDKITLISGLILGLGFGVGFMQSAIWTLGYGIVPKYIDWWKMWELNAGFNLGVLYALVFSLISKHFIENPAENKVTVKKEKNITYVSAFIGALFIFFMGFEYFFLPALILSGFFIFILLLSTRIGNNSERYKLIREKRLEILLIFTVFILVFLMLHGVSERAGIYLGLYRHEEVAQYSWPAERILLIIPFMILAVGILIKKLRLVLINTGYNRDNKTGEPLLKARMIELMVAMGFIGALSIWPSKIAVFYSFFLLLALFSFNRIDILFEKVNKK